MKDDGGLTKDWHGAQARTKRTPSLESGKLSLKPMGRPWYRRVCRAAPNGDSHRQQWRWALLCQPCATRWMKGFGWVWLASCSLSISVHLAFCTMSRQNGFAHLFAGEGAHHG